MKLGTTTTKIKEILTKLQNTPEILHEKTSNITKKRVTDAGTQAFQQESQDNMRRTSPSTHDNARDLCNVCNL